MAKKNTKHAESMAALTEIQGVGNATAEKLLKAFGGSLTRIAKADADTLIGRVKIPRKTAENIVYVLNEAVEEEASPPKPKPAPKAKAVKAPVPKDPDPLPPPPPAPKPVVPVPASPAKPRMPLPVPFGGRDVTIRTTPPPEVVDIQELRKAGAPESTPDTPPRAPALAAAPKPAPKPVVQPTAAPAPAARKRPRRRGRPAVATGPQLSGPPVWIELPHAPQQQGYVDRQDSILWQGARLFMLYAMDKKTKLGYGRSMRGRFFVQPGAR